jgi:hypothetical protein
LKKDIFFPAEHSRIAEHSCSADLKFHFDNVHKTSQSNNRDEHSDVKEILSHEVDVASFDWKWDAVTLYP